MRYKEMQRVGRKVQRLEGSEGVFPFWTILLDMMLNTLMPDPSMRQDTAVQDMSVACTVPDTFVQDMLSDVYTLVLDMVPDASVLDTSLLYSL